MSTYGIHGLGCGRRSVGAGAGAREPFAFPGTPRRYAPDRVVDIGHTRLEIALDPAVVAIAGVVTHAFTSLREGATELTLHAAELTIDAVEGEDGRPLPFRHAGHELHVTLPAPLAFGEASALRVRYRGEPRRGIYFIRPDAGYPDKPLQVWTQGQDEDSRYWFPCFDHPSEKASTELLARVPERYTAVSNGALVGREGHADGTATWHWRQAAEHPAYLVMLAVGEFEEVVLQADPVPLTAYVPRGRRADAERAFGRTAAMVALFEERFGVSYPYEKYAQVVVEDFIFGGMENTTATTLIDVVLYDERTALDHDLDDLVAHELAHQWWGDLLTCRDWSQAWLNEGFATWSQVVWSEHHEGADEAAMERLGMASTYRKEDGEEYRRPIVDLRYEAPLDLFDRHLYEKGGLVLHMLRRELGEDAFWRAIRGYARSHRGGSVVTEDLRRSIEASTGRDLEWFFDQWVHHAGHPEIEVAWKHDAKTRLLSLDVRQTHAAGPEVFEAFRCALDVDVRAPDGACVRRRFELQRREHTFQMPMDEAPAQVDVDPEGDLLAVVTIDQPADVQRRVLASEAPLVARIRAAQALGKEAAPENVRALAAVLPHAFWGLAAEAAKALGVMRTPAARDALIEALPRVAHPKARRGVVAALGAFRHDDAAAGALRAVLADGDASVFVEAEAARSLGATRAADARQVLERALDERDAWAETIRIGCVDGLAALGTPDVVPTLVARVAYGQPARLRAASARALARVARRMAERDPVLEVLGDLLGDPDFRVVLAAVDALRRLGDDRALPLLGGAPATHPDGRVRRAARCAAARLRKGSERSDEVTRLADDVDRLRQGHAGLLERVTKLEGRLPAFPPAVEDADEPPTGV